MSWQDISTAPRDGTVVDLWSNGRRFADFAFIESRGAWVRTEKMWRGDHQVTAHRHLDEAPTHWQPLPAAPSNVKT